MLENPSGCNHRIVLRAENVWFRYEDRYILKNVSLAIERKEIAVVMGPNGAGKSTLLKILSGILKPEKGSAYVCGYNTREVTEGSLAKFVGYIPQNPWLYLFSSRVLDEITFTAKNLGVDRESIEKAVLDVAARLDILDLLDRSPFTLSEGEARRVVIASALLHNPAVLLLDEPTAGLDYTLKKNFINIVKEISNYYGTTIVVSTHDTDLLTLLPDSRLVILYNGEIVYSGSVSDAIKRSESMYSYSLAIPAELELVRRFGEDVAEIQTLADALLYIDKLRDRICR